MYTRTMIEHARRYSAGRLAGIAGCSGRRNPDLGGVRAGPAPVRQLVPGPAAQPGQRGRRRFADPGCRACHQANRALHARMLAQPARPAAAGSGTPGNNNAIPVDGPRSRIDHAGRYTPKPPGWALWREESSDWYATGLLASTAALAPQPPPVTRPPRPAPHPAPARLPATTSMLHRCRPSSIDAPSMPLATIHVPGPGGSSQCPARQRPVACARPPGAPWRRRRRLRHRRRPRRDPRVVVAAEPARGPLAGRARLRPGRAGRRDRRAEIPDVRL
jgi:hypothetical protein